MWAQCEPKNRKHSKKYSHPHHICNLYIHQDAISIYNSERTYILMIGTNISCIHTFSYAGIFPQKRKEK